MKLFPSTLPLIALAILPFATLGQGSDDDAIKRAINAGWEASTAKNASNIKAAWKQDPHAVSTSIGRYNYANTNSWDSISASTDRAFKANPKPSRTSYTLRNHTIRSNGNMAFAAYEAVITPVNASPTSFPYTADSIHYQTYQVLEREGDQWKTIALINTDPQSYKDINTDPMHENKQNGADTHRASILALTGRRFYLCSRSFSSF